MRTATPNSRSAAPVVSDAPRPRRSGRPKGSSRYSKADPVTLRRLADALVREPDLTATMVLRRLGQTRDADPRRLQRKWKADRQRLLREAQLWLDAEPPTTFFGTAFAALARVSGFAENLMTSPNAAALRSGLERAARRHAAVAELGRAPVSPIDPQDPEAAQRAIDRFEARPHRTMEAYCASLPADLLCRDQRASQRLYATALIFHEMSLEELELELECERAATGTGNTHHPDDSDYLAGSTMTERGSQR